MADLRGEAVYMYAFDVAGEIRLPRAAELLAGVPAPAAPARERPAPRRVPAPRPLVAPVPDALWALGGRPVAVAVRVYAVGVVTVTARVPFAVPQLGDLGAFYGPRLDDGRTLDAGARECHARVRERLADALVRATPEAEPEAYTVFCLSDIGTADAPAWLAANERAVAGLLTATPGERLSAGQVAEVLRLRRSFEAGDLVVVDWDAALVVELGGPSDDVLGVLELANLQLEEFRWMDRALDGHLERAYADLADRHGRALGGSAGALAALRRLSVELARLADEVTHAGKLVGDWHLARVYALARERFHLDTWRASVAQRLAELDRLYTLARGDLYERRMLVLEVLIVVLFVIDLLVLALGR